MRETAAHAGEMRGPVFVGRVACSSPMRAAATHAHAALVYQLAGSAQVEQRGRWKLASGDVWLVPAGEPHRWLDARAREGWGLGFCGPCFPPEESALLLEPFERVRAGGAAVVRIPAPRQAFLETLFTELESACARLDAGALAAQRSLLTLVLDEVTRAPRAEPREHGPSLATECLRVIERRCLEPLSLGELAAAVRRTPSHVTTALRRATGRTAHEWILAYRMAEARRRLLHTDELVDVIAERVGYQDSTHFVRMFRRQHGATPAAWRRQHGASGH